MASKADKPDDWLVHILWEHYPEALPRWPETPLHIRQHLTLTASKIRETLREHPEAAQYVISKRRLEADKP